MDHSTPFPEESRGAIVGQSDQESLHLFIGLLELADDAILVRDPANRILFWNQGAERLYGWSAQEVMGLMSHDLLHTQFPTSREALDHVLASGARWDGELIHTRKDGSQVTVESRQTLKRIVQGERLAILEINRSIPEPTQQERETQEQYRTIVRTANEGIWLIDTQARTLFLNERMAEMLGSPVEEVVGHAVPEFVFPEDLPLAHQHIESNLAGRFEQFDFHFRCKDGTQLSVLACTSPVRDGRGQISGALGMFRAASDFQQSEQARRQLAALVKSAAIPIIGKTPEGIITSWNPAAERLYGYRAQEAVGQPITLIFPPDRQQEFLQIMERIRQGEQVDLYETVRRRKDGTLLPVSITVSPIFDGTGQISGASDIAHDITELKRLERQEQFLTELSRVLSSNIEYQQTLANVAHLVIPQLADWFAVDLADSNGHVELIEIAHKDPEKVQWARQLRERYPIDPADPTGLAAVTRTGQPELYPEVSDEMLVATTRDEQHLALARQVGFSSAMLVPLIARGRTIGVISFVAAESGKRYDKRDLALAEEVGRRVGIALDNARLYREVQQSRDQLAIILQGVGDGIVVHAPDSRLLYDNQTAVRATGAAFVRAMQITAPLDVTGGDELVDEHGQPVPPSQLTHMRVLAGEPEAQAIVGTRSGGSAAPEHWALVTSRPVRDGSGAIAMVVTIIHDITERMLAERRKDEFISMASHELKTPVTSLKGFTYVLQRRLMKQGDTQVLHSLTRMDAQLDKLTSLINELLDISRMQSGKLPLREEEVDLDALLEETVENVQAATLTHHLLIEGSTDAQVLGDHERLGQVFINLLTNAIKYSPGADKIVVRLRREGSPEQARVSIQDFGLGIEKAHHEKIFERFYQVTDPEEKTYPGLGIGLYISHEIVTRHHGRLWVESSKGHGATFSVDLPLLKTNEPTTRERTER